MEYDKREWQLYELSILDKVVEICNKYNIRYYLSSGTLLGAVRHKGFIPWDDDIDIEMTIKEYKRFCRIAPKELEERGLFLQTYKTDPEFSEMWAQIRANNTTSLPVKDYNWNIHWGVHIDIFPIIGLYDNLHLRKLQQKLYGFNQMLLEKDRVLSGSLEDYEPSKKIKMLYKIPRGGLHFIANLLNIYIDRSPLHTKEASIKWITLKSNRAYKYYQNTIKLEFEGNFYSAPKGYDSLLTDIYGDYMAPPPENRRDGHEMNLGNIIRDLKRDYSEYQRELKLLG